MSIRIGIVGYGVGGQLFHSPYVVASDECELVGVVARSESKQVAVREDHPGVAVVGSLAELIDLGVDAVVITTPPETRRDLVLEAIEAGVSVVADKPFAPTAEGAAELAEAAQAKGVVLNVFHNRRWDTDVVTARSVIDGGKLGTLRGLDLRLDLDEPGTVESGPGGGLLRDLGSHVVDQALRLMGPARTVYANLGNEERPEGETNVRFLIVLGHTDGSVSKISASKVDHLESKEIRVYGDDGSYVSDFRDVQTVDIKAGKLPTDDRTTWGIETEEHWGVLRTTGGSEIIPSEQGNYTDFYDRFARAVSTGSEGPVPAAEGIEVLQVLDAVVESAKTGTVVNLSV